MDRIRVLLVDDHALFRAGLALLLQGQLDIEIVGEAIEGQEAFEKAQELIPDVILMDLYMNGMNGLEATRRIKEVLPEVKIIMLTISEEDEDLFEAVKAGAHGYLVKKIEPSQFLDTLRGVACGEVPMSGPMARKILAELSRLANRGREEMTEPLSRREREVLEELTKGSSNKEIGASLFITENTVKNHLKNILSKLHLDNRVQAVAFALQKGLTKQRRA